MRVGFGVGISYINAPILSGYIDKEEEHEAWLWEDGSYMLWNNNEQVIISYKEEQETMIESIKQAMVLWYDIKRQGCTNENMADNPVLKDLSGNGHDATCYNFAWSGMSGIGGYNWNFNDFMGEDCPHTETTITFKTNEEVSLRRFLNYWTPKVGDIIHGAKIRVTGITGNGYFNFFTQLNSTDNSIIKTITNLVKIEKDGIYEVPDIPITSEWEGCIRDTYIGFNGIENIAKGVIVNIEQLPLYPDAIISDGVDDYAYVEGLPLLIEEKGYTVIAKRKWLSIRNDIQQVLCTKRNAKSFGAFVIEKGTGADFSVFNFNLINRIVLNKHEIVICTSSYYNDTLINKGDIEDNDSLALFEGQSYYNVEHSNIALYSFILFDRDLTSEEINWVKTNLIEQ